MQCATVLGHSKPDLTMEVKLPAVQNPDCAGEKPVSLQKKVIVQYLTFWHSASLQSQLQSLQLGFGWNKDSLMTWSDFSGTGMAVQDHSKVLVTTYNGTLAVEQLNHRGKGKDNWQLQNKL